MRKTFLAFLVCVGMTTIANAQFFKSIIPTPGFSSALEKIVLDFREDYKNIQGEMIDKQGGADVYESLVQLPGTTAGRIVRYHSLLDTTAGWQANVYEGEDFNEAAKAYQNMVRLLKKSRIKWIDRSMVGFSGSMEAPSEDIRFTTSTLKLQLHDRRYDRFEAQVEMISNFTGYTVQVSMHKRVKEIPDQLH